jgi:hypothetical protein
MTHRTQEQDMGGEEIRPLEFSAHCLWAEASGLAQLIRTAHPDELEACRAELAEAANIILALVERKQ